jgi:hypothetical protein
MKITRSATPYEDAEDMFGFLGNGFHVTTRLGMLDGI